MLPPYILLKPQVQTVTISPNPVNANATYSVGVTVIEIEVVLEPIIKYCGTFYCGEEGGIE